MAKKKTIEDWAEEVDVDESAMPNDYEEKYTDPGLRWRLKEAIQASGKGGRRGEWSARKAQLLVKAYEERGGDYKGDKAPSQESLKQWTAQDWQTSQGSADADSPDGMGRYLPEEAWALLKERDREAAEATKEEVDEDGGQYADWPEAVLRTMTTLDYADGDDELTKAYLRERAAELDIEGRSSMSKSELQGAILRAYRLKQGHYDALTKELLYERAAELDIEGRSSMSKSELQDALKARQGQ